MSKKLGVGTAFPMPETKDRMGYPGMSYRDWLIGMALQGELANSADGAWPAESFEMMAERVIKAVDAVYAEMDRDDD